MVGSANIVNLARRCCHEPEYASLNSVTTQAVEEVANPPPVCRVLGAHLNVRVTADISSEKTGTVLTQPPTPEITADYESHISSDFVAGTDLQGL